MSLYIISSLVFSCLIAQRCLYKPLSLLPGFAPPTSVPSPGAGGHAGGPGDLLRAAAAEAAEEDVLPEEAEAPGPPGHPGA